MTISDEKPVLIDQIGVSLFAYNHNPVQDETGAWHFDSYVFDHSPEYGEVINRIITDKYPNGEEAAIHRKGIVDKDNAEFVAYNQFVEQVKELVKTEFVTV